MLLLQLLGFRLWHWRTKEKAESWLNWVLINNQRTTVSQNDESTFVVDECRVAAKNSTVPDRRWNIVRGPVIAPIKEEQRFFLQGKMKRRKAFDAVSKIVSKNDEIDSFISMTRNKIQSRIVVIVNSAAAIYVRPSAWHFSSTSVSSTTTWILSVAHRIKTPGRNRSRFLRPSFAWIYQESLYGGRRSSVMDKVQAAQRQAFWLAASKIR